MCPRRIAGEERDLVQEQKPLVVDMDGSLLRTDSLQEAAAAALRHPGRLVRSALDLITHGRAAMKARLSTPDVDLEHAPRNAAVVQLIEDRAAAGATVVLATGANERLAAEVAAGIPLVAEVIASDISRNLTGERKADALVERFGDGGYDYVGNAEADRAIWQHADRKYLATLRRAGLPRWAHADDYTDVLRDPRPSAPRVWGRAVRVHQSMKNVLVFLPLLAAHEFTNPILLARSVGGFAAFSLMAFAVYLLNDTLDLAADRAHPRKRRRPLAAGWIPPAEALAVAVILSAAAVALGVVLGTTFLIVLVGYAVLTTSYSFWLKRIALVDIVVLALLYMIRIIAGAAATGIPLSFWFTAVTLFLFLSLALVKRYAEAHHARSSARQIRGRGYSGDDVHAILALGTSAGIAAVLVAAIYIQSDAVVRLYPAPQVLWAVIPLLFYWVANLWLKAGRGEMHDDPLVFALRDRASLIAAALIAVVFIAASIPAFDFLIDIGTLR